jgi:hypothetical protein
MGGSTAQAAAGAGKLTLAPAILAVTGHQVTKTIAQKRIKIAHTATSELLP